MSDTTRTRLVFLTSFSYPSHFAHPIHGLAMARAFAAGLGESFTFVVDQVSDRELLRGIRYVRLFGACSPLFRTFHLRTVGFIFWFAWFAIRQGLWGKKAIVYTNDIRLGLIAAIYRPVFRYTLVFESHGMYTRFSRIIVFAAASRLVFVTRALRELACIERPSRTRKSIVLSNAVDVVRFASQGTSIAEARRVLDLPRDRTLIGYIGRYWPGGIDKGIQFMLKALQELPEEYHMLFVGGAKGEIEEVYSLAQRYDVLDRTTFVPFVATEQLSLYACACDVLAYVPEAVDSVFHQIETSPMKLYEYMAARRPIVVSDTPAVREVLDESCAFFCAAGSVGSFATALDAAIREPEPKVEVAFARVKDNTWECRVARIVSFARSPLRKKVCYVVNARLPNKKAYGIQIAKMCEAFIERDVQIELVVPRTRASRMHTMRSFYGLRVHVPMVRLPDVDWYARGVIGFAISSGLFMLTSGLYLLKERLCGRLAAIYTVDMDTFSFMIFPLVGVPVVAEMHDSKPSTLMTRFFFGRVAHVVATNTEIRDVLQRTFKLTDNKCRVEPNGVDLQEYVHVPTKADARAQLGLPQTGTIALYLGRFYPWKGLEVLIKAAALEPKIQWCAVGGDASSLCRASGMEVLPLNVVVAGECSVKQVPIWLAAADVLLVLGTARNQRSFRFTSPMKLFEYMAVGRPIVVSATPALKSLVADAVQWYEPDDASSLAQAVVRAIDKHTSSDIMRTIAGQHAWDARAERISTILMKYV